MTNHLAPFLKNYLNKISVLNDFYWDLSGSESFSAMTDLWKTHPKAAALGDVETDSHAMHFLSQQEYKDAVDAMVADVQNKFGAKFHAYVIVWNAAYPNNAVEVCHTCGHMSNGGSVQLVMVDREGNHFCQNCQQCAHGISMNISCDECEEESAKFFAKHAVTCTCC